MGMYNYLDVELDCPRCGAWCAAEVEFGFGLLDLRRYAVGDLVDWGVKGLRRPRGRPPGGDLAGEGYAECRCCRKDYFVLVRVEADRIVSVEVDPARPGHLP